MSGDPDAAVFEFDSGAESDPGQLRERSKPKKGRGRPPKKGKQVTFEDDDETPATTAAVTTGESPPPSSSGPDDIAIAQLKRQIKQMKTGRLNAVGTGLDPDSGSYTREQLQTEFDLLNAEVNERRGDKAVRGLFDWAVPFVQSALQSTGRVDVESKYKLVDEVKGTPELFDEALEQLAVKYGGWFAVGPESALVQALGTCVDSVNRKNKAHYAHMRGQQQTTTPLATSGANVYADEGPVTAQNSPLE